MLYWHKNGFNLLYKRLEKERFKIPKLVAARCITYEQLLWLFDGLDIDKITAFNLWTKTIKPLTVSQEK